MYDELRLRPVEAFPIEQDGQTFVCLRDPYHFSKPILVSPPAYFVLAHLDGQHSFIDIQAAYCQRFGQLLLSEDLKALMDLLDQNYYLHNQRFIARQRQVVDEFSRQPTRVPALAGSVYKEAPDGLAAQLDGYFSAPEGPGLPDTLQSDSVPKALVSPHIDFQRGGPYYAWAYRELIHSEGADLYVLFGTSHGGGQSPFVATLKDFETPFGVVETDKSFLQELQRGYGVDLFCEEFLHRSEHSLEFQVVFLKYVAHRRAAQIGGQKPFKIVPLLVSSFHSMVRERTLPGTDPGVGDFLNRLVDLVQREKRQVCFVAGVDLAHVGTQFGDPEAVTPSFLKWVETEDHRLIERLAALDAEGLFHEIAKDQDRRRICGFSPLYSLVHVLSRVVNASRGELLKYSQSYSAETGSAVTFTSMVFD
jgi:AmmeMemoRadiSam system protein B